MPRSYSRPCNFYYNDFNPRTHKECDCKKSSVNFLTKSFQSTHSQGVRPDFLVNSIRHICISIHALTRSATENRFNNHATNLISIHALTRSATGAVPYPGLKLGNFNPRTHKECDFDFSVFTCLTSYFNPRTHKECDAIVSIRFLLITVFQSTHSQGVRRQSQTDR